MKITVAALMLVLGGCASGPLPWATGPQQGEAECSASCAAHFEQCPRIFAEFPERGAVECPAERDNCMKSCGTRQAATRAVAAPVAPAVSVPASPAPVSSKESRLRELKRLHDEGLVSEDVYRERQRVILSEP